MVGIYFSGTGNTKYCITKLIQELDKNSKLYSIEDKDSLRAINENEIIIFGYPIYYSNLPKIVKDFIENNAKLFYEKKIFILATMGLFSGDGTGCSARLFKKYGATILGGIHIQMPDCIGDVKLLKKPLSKNIKIIDKANQKLDDAVHRIKKHHYPRQGLGFGSHLAGLFGQRLYFSSKTKKYYTEIKIDYNVCVRCGYCAKNCPMENISITKDSIELRNQCIMCYRCFSYCKEQAITILGNKLYEQSYIEKYIKG